MARGEVAGRVEPQPTVQIDVNTALEAVWLIRALMKERSQFSLVIAERVQQEIMQAVARSKFEEEIRRKIERL